MKSKLLSLSFLLLALFTVSPLEAEPTYVQPTVVVPNWGHANSQCLYSIQITSNGKKLLDYNDAEGRNPYNWLQNEQFFEVTPGQELTIIVRAGIWSWDIHLGFDWDGNGSFEDVHRAFSSPNRPVSKENSSWGVHAAPFNNADWRRQQEALLGHRGVLYKEFRITVPQDAADGNFRMRVLCDGDGYNGGQTPPFNMNAGIGYAGSMTDFGIHVKGTPSTDKPVASLAEGLYKEDQYVNLTSSTPGARIYYTTDGTEPSETNGTLYDDANPILVSVPELTNGTVTLKAISYSDELDPSRVVTFVYRIQKSWSEPGGTFHPTEDRYITKATTTGAKVDLNYTQSANPKKTYINTNAAFTVEPNTSFDLTVKGYTSLVGWEYVNQLKWCHAIIFVDWNQNQSFDDPGEQIVMIGQENTGVDEVGDFTRTINVPETARAGQTRLRIQYTDAWHKKNIQGHTHSGDDDVDKGGVYDFILNIEKNYPISINGVVLTSANSDSLTFANAEGYVSCDGDTLTFHNFKMNATAGSTEGLVRIKSDKQLVIKLEGENELSTEEDYMTGIYADCPQLTFVGSGSLLINAPQDAAIFAFKTCKAVTFKDSCTVEASGKWGLLGSNLLEGQTLTIDSCTVKATGTDGSIISFKTVALNKVGVEAPAQVDYADGTFKVGDEVVKEQIVIKPALTTGVTAIQTEVTKRHAIYNLNGMKMNQDVDKLPKGIYIVDGKKVVIR